MITGIGCAAGLGPLVEVSDERDGERLPGRVVAVGKLSVVERSRDAAGEAVLVTAVVGSVDST